MGVDRAAQSAEVEPLRSLFEALEALLRLTAGTCQASNQITRKCLTIRDVHMSGCCRCGSASLAILLLVWRIFW